MRVGEQSDEQASTAFPLAEQGLVMSISKQVRILLVDDHPVLREGLSAIVGRHADMEIVGEAGNGAEAVECFRSLSPDVTLMDIQMPAMDGIGALLEIRKHTPDARVIMLTTYAGDVRAVRALKAGAAGYLLKSSLRKELIDVIRLVHAGKRHVPADVAQEIAIHTADETLSERELDILRLVSEGKPNKSIAWVLSLSEETVKAHMKKIFAKLDVSDRTHAVIVAVRRGVIAL